MGSRAVRDLVEQPDVEALVIGDYDEAKARALAASIGALMLGRGAIAQRGVIGPEACVPPGPFISELAKRGIRIFGGDRLEDVIA